MAAVRYLGFVGESRWTTHESHDGYSMCTFHMIGVALLKL